LIGRPADVGTKFLRKYESAPLCRFPGHASEGLIGDFGSAQFENNVDIVAHSRGLAFRLRSVNRNRKGLRSPRLISAYLAHQRRRSFELAVMKACVKSGNGEQPWL
jgi:hypothetical protein